jgi:DNA primase
VVLGVDEHAEQTRAILASQRHAASLAGLVARADRERLRTLHSNAQRLLRPYPVVIPEMTTDFPANATRHRRDHAKLLSIIAAITVLHQFQRDVKTAVVGDTTLTYLEASQDDINTGLELASRVLVRTDQHLAPQSARLFSRFLEFAGERAHEGGVELGDVGITRRELRETLGWSDTQVRSATDRLVALEYLVVSPGGRGRCRTYHYVPPIGEVRGPVAPVRPPRSRTAPTLLPGRTEEFVTLVGLGAPRKGKRPIVGAPTKERS